MLHTPKPRIRKVSSAKSRHKVLGVWMATANSSNRLDRLPSPHHTPGLSVAWPASECFDLHEVLESCQEYHKYMPQLLKPHGFAARPKVPRTSAPPQFVVLSTAAVNPGC